MIGSMLRRHTGRTIEFGHHPKDQDGITRIMILDGSENEVGLILVVLQEG